MNNFHEIQPLLQEKAALSHHPVLYHQHPVRNRRNARSYSPSPFQWDEYSKSPDYTWLPATKAERHPHGVETLTDKSY